MPPTAVGHQIFPHLEMETSLKLSPRGSLTEERPLASEAWLARTGCKIFGIQVSYSMSTHRVVTFVKRAAAAYRRKSDRASEFR